MDTLRILLISTYPPTRCGIATFSRSLVSSMQASSEDMSLTIGVAAIDRDQVHAEPSGMVVYQINPDLPDCFEDLADFVNDSEFDVVSLQHEFGLYGGVEGDHILRFLERCRKPVVTTCHTVLDNPKPETVRVMTDIARNSAAIVVMANAAVGILEKQYRIRGENIAVIPHGVPEFNFTHKATIKRCLGLAGKKVIATFGLISRGKGLEYMIRAMHIVLREHPDAVYLVIGQTHPCILAKEGESYRRELERLAAGLPNPDAVVFVNKFVNQIELTEYLQATDVYVTPYLDYNQITSGTLSYALAAGKAIVSTPYIHATEALAEGRGMLVPFKDHVALGRAVVRILSDRLLAETLEARAYDLGRRWTWPAVGRQYVKLLAAASDGSLQSVLAAMSRKGYRTIRSDTYFSLAARQGLARRDRTDFGHVARGSR